MLLRFDIGWAGGARYFHEVLFEVQLIPRNMKGGHEMNL